MNTTCNKYRALIDQLALGDLEKDSEAQVATHVDECASCTDYLRETRESIALVTAVSVPQRDDAYWDSFYDRIVDRINEEDAAPVARRKAGIDWERVRDIILPRQPAMQLAYGVALLVIGLFLGRAIFQTDANDLIPEVAQSPQISPEATSPGDTPAVELASLDARSDRFLDRSKVLLLGIVNMDTDDGSGGYNMDKSRLVARQLVKESVPLRRELEVADQRRLMKLMDDLEVILLQIANLEESADIPAIEMVKDGVDQRGVLLKINVTEMRNDFKRDGL